MSGKEITVRQIDFSESHVGKKNHYNILEIIFSILEIRKWKYGLQVLSLVSKKWFMFFKNQIRFSVLWTFKFQ